MHKHRVSQHDGEVSINGTTLYNSMSALRNVSNLILNSKTTSSSTKAPSSYNVIAPDQPRKTIKSLSHLFNSSDTTGQLKTLHHINEQKTDRINTLNHEDSAVFPSQQSQTGESEWSVEYVTDKQDIPTKIENAKSYDIMKPRSGKENFMRNDVNDTAEETQMGLLEFGMMEKRPIFQTYVLFHYNDLTAEEVVIFRYCLSMKSANHELPPLFVINYFFTGLKSNQACWSLPNLLSNKWLVRARLFNHLCLLMLYLAY